MISSLVRALISTFKARRELALKNVALRQQLAVLRRSVKRPRLSKVDRGFWVLLRRIWTDWESVLVIVKPETVIRWHRCGFRRYWTWKSRRRRPGRPGVAPEIRELIQNMSRANPVLCQNSAQPASMQELRLLKSGKTPAYEQVTRQPPTLDCGSTHRWSGCVSFIVITSGHPEHQRGNRLAQWASAQAPSSSCAKTQPFCVISENANGAESPNLGGVVEIRGDPPTRG